MWSEEQTRSWRRQDDTRCRRIEQVGTGPDVQELLLLRPRRSMAMESGARSPLAQDQEDNSREHHHAAEPDLADPRALAEHEPPDDEGQKDLDLLDRLD